jgi:hypothetical protein
MGGSMTRAGLDGPHRRIEVVPIERPAEQPVREEPEPVPAQEPVREQPREPVPA